MHLDERELAEVAESGATLVHNPESNSNNGVGRLDLQACDRTGVRLALGTDGMSGNMLRSLRAAFLGLRSGMRDPSLGFSIIPELLSANTRRAAELFAEPLLGSLQIGSPGDVVVVDQAPATPVDDGNWFGHLVYGASESPVRHTIAGGRVVLEDFRHVGLDVEGLSREAQTIAPALWERFRTLPPNAPR